MVHLITEQPLSEPFYEIEAAVGKLQFSEETLDKSVCPEGTQQKQQHIRQSTLRKRFWSSLSTGVLSEQGSSSLVGNDGLRSDGSIIPRASSDSSFILLVFFYLSFTQP
jgi:hypothetical protein